MHKGSKVRASNKRLRCTRNQAFRHCTNSGPITKTLETITMNLNITVMTVSGCPQFSVPADSTPAQVRKLVARKFGYVCIGVPHSWYGVLNG